MLRLDVNRYRIAMTRRCVDYPLIHAALTVVPIWVITYIFLPKVYRIYKLRNEKKEDK